ncbi:hypothetical protein MUN88_07220 [Gracilibacillus caseinilyticus]|uniref:CAAX protease self-immunity n=1 Tax=Gracilibacillus caseinilyticus TaxID=2932256 RepID=A0ABY4F5Y0_9BACI|nr:hypothetical protein [Gracilibacillus caseinilyticus]UOQ49856.1 hypothetical protein MUN88_07220 [Gracilibacillus caseinilyticus]
MKNHKMKDIVIKIFTVLVLGIIIWNSIAYLSDMFMGQEYNSLSHFIIALITTVLTVTLIQVVLKTDKTSWTQLGQSTFKTNIFSFFLGFSLWTIPASIGLFICLMLGWVEIEIHTDLYSLMGSILILFITVFFIEALPEELEMHFVTNNFQDCSFS